MTVGRILDFCIETINTRNRAEKKEGTARMATQKEIDAWLGGTGRRK